MTNHAYHQRGMFQHCPWHSDIRTPNLLNKEVDEDEEADEHEHEDNGKEPRMIRQGEIVHTSADDADTIADNQRPRQREQCQGMRVLTARPQSPSPAPQANTSDPPSATTPVFV
jgi:hypothetical protein